MNATTPILPKLAILSHKAAPFASGYLPDFARGLFARLESAPKPARLLLLAFMVLFVVGPVTSLVLWMIKRGMTQ